MYNLSMNKLVAGSKGFLVSSEHLMEALHAKVPLRILDTTLFRPLVDKDNNSVYLKERIPGASFLDIDTVADHSIEGITHQTPLEKEWVQFMQTYDVSASDDIVLYDDLACAGASKFWWSFAQYGKEVPFARRRVQCMEESRWTGVDRRADLQAQKSACRSLSLQIKCSEHAQL